MWSDGNIPVAFGQRNDVHPFQVRPRATEKTMAAHVSATGFVSLCCPDIFVSAY